jgi:hypothetical protein
MSAIIELLGFNLVCIILAFYGWHTTALTLALVLMTLGNCGTAMNHASLRSIRRRLGKAEFHNLRLRVAPNSTDTFVENMQNICADVMLKSAAECYGD